MGKKRNKSQTTDTAKEDNGMHRKDTPKTFRFSELNKSTKRKSSDGSGKKSRSGMWNVSESQEGDTSVDIPNKKLKFEKQGDNVLEKDNKRKDQQFTRGDGHDNSQKSTHERKCYDEDRTGSDRAEDRTGNDRAARPVSDASMSIGNRIFTISDQSSLLILQHDEEVSVQGKVLLKLLGGSVEVYGTLLTPKHDAIPVYSAACASLLSIKTVKPADSSTLKEDLMLFFNNLEAQEKSGCPSSSVPLTHDSRAKINECIQQFGSRCVVLLLTKLESAVSDVLASITTFQNIFEQPSRNSRRESYASDFVYVSSCDVYLTTRGSHHRVWQPITAQKKVVDFFINKAKEGPTASITLCGGKNVGKSSMARYLVNKTLSHFPSVAFLECDVGQTELSPPGCLALHVITEPLVGPPFSHQRKAERMCFLGASSPGDNPYHYQKCLEYIYRKYEEMSVKPPLIVNTMGWNKGLGLMFLSDILRMVKPNVIVQLDSHSQPRNLPIIDDDFLQETPSWVDHMEYQYRPSFDFKLFRIDSPVTHSDERQSRYRPADHRHMSLLGHLAPALDHLSPAHLSGQISWSSLLAVKPYSVPWSSVGVRVCHSKVAHSQILYAFNAAVVALCSLPSNRISHSEDGGLPGFIDANPVCDCLSLGLVRGIDPIKKLFYITCGLTPAEMKAVNCLLTGSLDLPSSVILAQKSSVGAPVPYTGVSKDVHGATSIKPRRHMMSRKCSNDSPHH